MISESQIQKCKKILHDEIHSVYQNPGAESDEIIEKMFDMCFSLQGKGKEIVDEFFEKYKNSFPEMAEFLNENKVLELKAFFKGNFHDDDPALSFEENFRNGARFAIENIKKNFELE